MVKYYLNKKTGDLISFNVELREITEFSEIRNLEKDLTLMEISIVKTENKKSEKSVTVQKVKGDRKCSDCGRDVPKGKYLCKGLCSTCYQRGLYQKKSGKVVEKKRDDGPKKYVCIDCDEEILSTLEVDKVKCPNNLHHTMVQK
ncbi:hypothetical protein CVU83_01775 [Candidatus Falkowbacteria bacterium HGW-Falkowbacteria-2]|uniref:Uncharacterized protein n=1 Tax=Candidatus Falkowbacteria bacterium HGW-Falkowbacteria-2 TaxID=2013769 RepID=A0A2N2E161_9BACT|nr:MAG: hypothetical protein CVU83_01775 [Candidatus Falkowbacteria bacterium HGW-Falkowbacteria-2]